MAGIVKNAVRLGVIGTIVGGAAIIAFPGRAGAIACQAKSNIENVIDRNIDDPVKLRQQLHELEGKYPKKIGQVRADLGELQVQIAEVQREYKINQRVVSYADQDLAALEEALGEARNVRAGRGGYAIVRVVLDGRPMEPDQAMSKGNEIRETRSAYAARASDLEVQLGYLNQQEQRLAGLLTKLETERSEFQAQLWQLNREIDSIARNERMIEMMERRQKTIDELSPYSADTVKQVKTRIASVLSQQEQRLEALAGRDGAVDYEERAKWDLDREERGVPSESDADASFDSFEPEVIDLTPRSSRAN
jgi:chromosome segregation ATPase